MKMIRVLFFVIMSLQSYAQFKKVIDPSPTSKEFEKYVNYSVSLYNGVPEITILLHEIAVGKARVPIELKYHASGIKYNQVVGEVGVGWVIEPGHRISRTVKHLADEYYNKPALNDSLYHYDPKIKDQYLNGFNASDKMLYPMNSARFDGEYDMFTYSIGTSRGSFIIEDRQKNKLRQISRSNDSISFSRASNRSIDYFDIVDGEGVKYRMGKSMVSGSRFIERNQAVVEAPSIVPTSWMLTDIVDPFGRYARFNYGSYQETAESPRLVKFSTEHVIGPPFPDNAKFATFDVTEEPYQLYEVKRLQRIDTEREVVEFKRSTYGELNEIVIKDLSGNQLKKIIFNYQTNIKKLLTSITIYGTGTTSPKTYTFDYYQHLSTNVIADYWGYYKTHSGSVVSKMPDFSSLYSCFAYDGQGVNSILYGNDRVVGQNNDAAMLSLKTITYPTGGSTQYEYEPHQYIGLYDGSTTSGTKYAGIRIKRIISNDSVRQETLIKEYKYGENENGVGEVLFDIADKRYFIKHTFRAIDLDAVYSKVLMGAVITFSSNPLTDLSELAFAGSPVHYSKVTEYSKEITSSVAGNGKIEYEFQLPTVPTTALYLSNYNYYGTRSFNTIQPPFLGCLGPNVTGNIDRDPWYSQRMVYSNLVWQNPFLKTKKVYKLEGNQYTTVETESNVYTSLESVSFMNLKLSPFFTAFFNYTAAVDYYSTGLNSLFDYGIYETSCGNQILTKKILSRHYGNQVISEEIEYSYNANFQLAKELRTMSDRTYHVTHYKYPVDYFGITSADAISLGVKKLQDNNMLNFPVEKFAEVLDSNKTNKKLVSSTFYTYKQNQFVLDKIFEVDGNYTDFFPSAVQNGSLILDSRYQAKILFHNYDQWGNLMNQSRANGPKESYLWGYNNYYPIAAVKNAGVNEFHYEGFEGSPVYQNLILDNSRVHTGKYSGRISNSGSGEVTSHGGPRTQIGLTSPKKFTYSGWIYSDGPAAQIFLFMMRAGEPGYFSYADNVNSNTIGKWVYVQKEVMVPGDVAEVYLRLDNDGGGNVWFDDLRIYPSEGEMKTYTYEPLIGMTSEMDTKGQTIYYEYDSFHRLKYSRDQNRNIIKSFDYHFKP